MSVSLVSASSQYLLNSAPPLPSTAYPFTVGLWVRPTALGGSVRIPWSFGDTALTNTYIGLLQRTDNTWSLRSSEAGTTNDAVAAASVVVQNAWSFIVLRGLSSINRRIQGVNPDGSVFAASAAGANAPTSLDAIGLGCRVGSTPSNLFDGQIAEFWYTKTGILGKTGDFENSFVRRLAYGGPFSVSDVAEDILEYRSMRSGLTSGPGREIYNGGGAKPQLWSNVNGATLGIHPTLPYWYENPRQTRSRMVF